MSPASGNPPEGNDCLELEGCKCRFYVQFERRPTRELGGDAFCVENSNFVRHPLGLQKFESNGERRVRLTVEVWVKMCIFSQLCQGGFHSRIFAKGFQGLSKDT